MTRLLAAALLAGLALPAHPQGVPAPAADPIQVLLLTGANNHDWEWSSASLEGILEDTGRFDVTVTREAAATLANPDAIAPFQVFLLDYNGPRWGEPAERNFLEAVRGGVGVVVVHAANNAFPGWIEYERMVALCWREGTGHGSFHPFGVRMVDRDHPITRTLPEITAHPDELYHRLKPMHGADYRVLAVAHSTPESRGSGRDEPMVIVKEYGRGRVFHTPLGHVWRGQPDTHASHADPQFAQLIARGTEWAATGDVLDEQPPPPLEDWDRRAGWVELFDGTSTDGWRPVAGDAIPPGRWVVENGALRVLAAQGLLAGMAGCDLVSTSSYRDFELAFDWKVGAGANSGVKVRVLPGSPLLGPEYQILDDAADTAPAHSAAALYGVVAPRDKALAPVGSWNHARIVARGNLLEHWLNGTRVLRAEVGTPAWDTALAASKFRDVEGFATTAGPIGLQDHGGEAWYRAIRIRDLGNLPGSDVELFDGTTLAGWRELGDAAWSVEDGAIVGVVGGGGQSFLATEGTYADFFLDVELRNDAPGNSGVQVRSTIGDNGLLQGYQIEIDPSERAWSGGLYDEGRRGWLQDLAHHPAGRAAFRDGEWNHYRIECVGPSVRVWVNGVQTVDWVEPSASPLTAAGRIGLQVHSGSDTAMRWRNLRLRVLD